MFKEINKFHLRRGDATELRQTLLDLAQNLSAGEARFGRERLRSGAWSRTQTMDRAEECDSGIDVVVADIDDLPAVDPAQQRISVLIIYADDSRHRIDAMVLHEPKRADFGRQPITAIVLPRRILLQRENAGAAAHAPDAAVTSATENPAQLDGPADKGAGDIGRLCQTFVNGAQKSDPQCHASSRKRRTERRN